MFELMELTELWKRLLGTPPPRRGLRGRAHSQPYGSVAYCSLRFATSLRENLKEEGDLH